MKSETSTFVVWGFGCMTFAFGLAVGRCIAGLWQIAIGPDGMGRTRISCALWESDPPYGFPDRSVRFS
jgi:hypothetical protein